MSKRTQEIKWKLHNYKYNKLLIWGLKNRYIAPYDDELINRLRSVYYGGIPASIILLSNGMSNGYCYDRATLMARAFLDTEDDVQLVYATIDSLRLNPEYEDKTDPDFADHCIVERTTKDGQHIIYDTSVGFAFDKRLYWLMEHPKVRKINPKEVIIKFVRECEDYGPEDIERDKYAAPLIIPNIERVYGRPNEMYTHQGIELLQREINHYKSLIDYDVIDKEIKEDMRSKGFRI